MCAILQDFPYAECRSRHARVRFNLFGKSEIQSNWRGSKRHEEERTMRESIERWMQLCAQAATEEDPTRLIALVNEINDLLEQKERRLGMLRALKCGSESSVT